jgi:sirohydrochlorin cobaltochelatase
MVTERQDPRAPMASAPMKYREDGEIDWGNMWDTFCVLAQEGGPPHRSSLLEAPREVDPKGDAYRTVVGEICRGIKEVSGLEAAGGEPGWVVVFCESPAHARWLSEAIVAENVQARAEGAQLFVPAGAHFTVKGEIKNVITAVAKTTHYWGEHLPPEVKQTLALQVTLSGFGRRLRQLVGL